MIQLMMGDCLERMNEIEAGSIDLILADLPYGTTANPWDVVIPLESLWAHYRRLLKPKGTVILTASQPFTSMLVMSNIKMFKYEIIWKKNRFTNFYNSKYQPGKVHENIIVFSGGAASRSPRGNMTYHPQMRDGKSWVKYDRGSKRKFKFDGAPRPNLMRSSKGGRIPISVIEFDCEYDYHATQKPRDMMEYLVRTYSDEGNTVLDNAMGSGTTCVACINTNRNFIGIEKDPEIFAVACVRIEDHGATQNISTEVV